MTIVHWFFKDSLPKQVLAWSFFDFANSAYVVLILSFIFPIYFKEVIVGEQFGDLYWGIVVSTSILLGGLLSPLIGVLADEHQRKKKKFVIFTLLAVIGTAALYFTGSQLLLVSALLFIATNVCFELAVVLYDSFLKQVSTPHTISRISGLGWGLGYIGGIVAMLLLQPFFGAGFEGGLESLYKLTFPLTALFFLIFSLPALFFIKEKKTPALPRASLKSILLRLHNTFKDVKKYKHIAWFLAGFYFLNDALVTIFSFLPLFVRTTLGLTLEQIMIIIILTQLIGFPSTVIFGVLADKFGHKKILLSTIVTWIIVIVGFSLAQTLTHLYILAVLAGLVVGANQAVARSWFSTIIPPEKHNEFFGFNGFASKVSAILGPLLFGVVSVVTNNQRLAILTILPFFVIALIIFSRLPEKQNIAT